MTKTKAGIRIPADISYGDVIRDSEGTDCEVQFVLPDRVKCWNGCVFTWDGWHLCRELGYTVKITRKSAKKERVPSAAELEFRRHHPWGLDDPRPAEILSGIYREFQAIAVHLTALTRGFRGRH